jgi:hypothetical protein
MTSTIVILLFKLGLLDDSKQRWCGGSSGAVDFAFAFDAGHAFELLYVIALHFAVLDSCMSCCCLMSAPITSSKKPQTSVKCDARIDARQEKV